MVRISPYKISRDAYTKVFSVFYEVIGKGCSRDEFDKILFELLSPSERIMIVKRIAVIYLLMKNVNYKSICSILKVSYTTVSKFRIIMEDSKGIVPALTNKVVLEKISLALEDLFNKIFAPGVYGVNWKTAWQNKFDLERRKETGI